MRVALVYDRVNKVGGAERVLMALHGIWPEAPLFTSVYSPAHAPWAREFTVITSFLNRLPGLRAHHEWLFWLMPLAFESFDFSQFDVVISVTSAEAKGVITAPRTFHVCYFLTPPKYLWSQTKLHLDQNPLGRMGKLILLPLFSRMRRWDYFAGQRPDYLVAISQSVAGKVKKYYRREVDEVVYPPVDISKISEVGKNSLKSSYFLLVSRLVPAKRVEVVVQAFRKLSDRLVVVGTGSEEKKLKIQATANVTFTGLVTDNELVGYYQNCRAVIMPQEEDFGIVALEALAAGKPVISFNAGGVREIVIEGKTGTFFGDCTPGGIMKAIRRFETMNFDSKMLITTAQQFDTVNFQGQFRKVVEKAWQNYQH